MDREPAVLIGEAAVCSDAELEDLLHRVYVDGGFTDPDVARTLLRADAVRARGELICMRATSGELAGMVLVVSEPPARRLAAPGECEMHLLAVAPALRARGLGKALVSAALCAAARRRFSRMVLWTQRSMHAAQRLYVATGFLRAPDRDFAVHGREFLVFQRELPPAQLLR